MSDARLIDAINSLIACKDLEELASRAALLAQQLLGGAGAVVVLRSSDREFASPAASACAELAPWATGLATLPPRGLVSAGPFRAARIDPVSADVQGVLAVSLEASAAATPAGGDTRATAEREAVLTALADVVASCSAQLARRAQADRNLQDTRALVARGLHDLCTPLNSLRLGMHLLEPALTNKDPAVAQRAHRAVDRMAALVTGMAEAVSGATGNGASAQPSSTTQH